ncbi:helix-hairpin-helix motif [Lucifera butyrica]|uniref:Helix-hairpin-helix motif n=2 Tax=Lucifera butyrica TaxID=1351585 RepID=A0A498R5K6_9FIRM|nr:helix-hairpin-helix motif [Lucifera butyrica]
MLPKYCKKKYWGWGDRMDQNRRKAYGILILTGLLLLGGSLFGFWQKNSTENYAVTGPANHKPPVQTNTGEVVVYVSGAVNKPGVFKITSGARTLDAINMAGGMAPGADSGKVNMAQPVKDGMQIHVPGALVAQTINTNAGNQSRNDARININTAEKAALDNLPGIGPSLAERIVKYRQANGAFGELTDLKKVPGIGDAKYNRLKDKITL